MNPMKVAVMGGGNGSHTIAADLAFFHQLFERLTHAVGIFWGKGVIVELIQVDHIGIEASQGCLARLPDIFGFGAASGDLTAFFVEDICKFRGNDDFMTATRQRLG